MSKSGAASWIILCGTSLGLAMSCGSGTGQLSNGSGGSAAGGGIAGGAGQGAAGGGSCTPSPELCNGFDDDCDGQVDEECPCVQGEEKACYSGDPSTNGVGACKSGTQKCDETGTFGACDGEVTPSEEVCNKLDDDCDGEVDEGLGEETCGEGACQVTVKVCVGGEVQQCMPGHPDPESCDGNDNDCDGTVDEGCDCVDGQKQACYTGAPATKNVGECKDGEQVCAGGKWGACQGDVVPAIELCDGKDNNCDGQPDDGNPGSGQGCDAGNLGVCKAGQTDCQGGALVCVQLLQPSGEKCDGLDNDCDGQTDEGNPEGGGLCNTGFPGICSVGTQLCQNGSLKCVQDKMSGPEQCNNLDDDCDGATDEGNPGGGNMCNTGMPGICAGGTQTCTGGVLSCVQSQQAQAESCNNQDDDCDGQIDEGNPGGGGNCSTGLPGICSAGTMTCQNGSLSCKQSQQAQPEKCGNNLDDDCDGQVDESCSPSGCKATAVPGVFICISNQKVSSYGTASHCMACTEKGLQNACVDKSSCIQPFTNTIVQELYFERTGQTCTAQPQQGPSCGWGEIMTPNYQPANVCPTPQDCTTSINWANCTYGVGGYDAYIYGVCKL